jgi:hypothetical protein
MTAHFTDAPGPIYHSLFVRPDAAGKFTGGVLGLPEVCVTADTEVEALHAVKRALLDWLATTRWVQMRVPDPAMFHPSVEFVGLDKDEAAHQEYLEILRKMKEEDLERTLREYEEEDRRAAEQAARSAGTNGPSSDPSPRTEVGGRQE